MASTLTAIETRGQIMWDPESIHARLAAMRIADPAFSQFGAQRHHYKLGPALTEAEVTAFEAEHGVTLPASYRSFLAEVGDGGAGPHYGLFPLDGDGMRDYDRAERLQRGHLATPFPHTEQWNPEHAGPPDAPNLGPADAMSEDEYFDLRWTAGSLIIAEFGCGAFHRLIVSGPARGQVWFDDCANDAGLTPGAEFEPWYLDWLTNLP